MSLSQLSGSDIDVHLVSAENNKHYHTINVAKFGQSIQSSDLSFNYFLLQALKLATPSLASGRGGGGEGGQAAHVSYVAHKCEDPSLGRRRGGGG